MTDLEDIKHNTIFVWKPGGGSVGHCSLRLTNESYVSWWPSDDIWKGKRTSNMVKVHHNLPGSYSDDVKLMDGSEATDQFLITSNKIDVHRIATWWEKYKLYGGGYCLINHNCCDVVLKALEIGGAFQWVHPGIKVISTPIYMAKYSRELKDAISQCSFISHFRIISLDPATFRELIFLWKNKVKRRSRRVHTCSQIATL